MTRAYPFLGMVLSWGLGIFIHETLGYRHISWLAVQGLIIGLAAGSFLARSRPRMFVILFYGLIVFTAVAHAHAYRSFSAGHIFYAYSDYFDQTVAVEGVVAGPIRRTVYPYGQSAQFELDLRRVGRDGVWRRHTGRVLARVPDPDVPWVYGDRIVLTGMFSRPVSFGRNPGFSYSRFLHRRGIMLVLKVSRGLTGERVAAGEGASLKQSALAGRRHLTAILQRYLSPAEAGMTAMILLGERSGVPRSLREVFARTGTAHILAISGLHVGIVAGMIMMFLRLLPIGLRGQYALTIMLVAGYALMTGASPSVVRAAVMIGIFLGGFILEREPSPINSLALAAGVILVLNPMALFEAGFQLSFASVTGILCGAGPCLQMFSERPLWRSAFWRYLVTSGMVSLAAGFAVGGIIAYDFQIITPMMFLANLLVVPLGITAVALGMGLMLFSPFPWAAAKFAVCLKAVLNGTVALTTWLSRCPGAFFPLPVFSVGWVIGYYALLIGGFFWWHKRWRRGSGGIDGG